MDSKDTQPYIYVYSFSKSLPHTSSKLPHNWAEFPVLYSRFLLVTHYKYRRVYMLIPNSLTISSPFFFPITTVTSFSKSVSTFLLQKYIHLYNFFLDSTYKGCFTIFLLPWLTSFSRTVSRPTHVVANGIISFFFNGRVVVHRMYVPPLLCPFLSMVI